MSAPSPVLATLHLEDVGTGEATQMTTLAKGATSLADPCPCGHVFHLQGLKRGAVLEHALEGDP